MIDMAQGEDMNVKKFKFPEVSDADLAFGIQETNAQLLAEAKKRGFYNGKTKYNDLFSQMFFTGGKLNFKENLDERFKNKAVPYLKGFMRSFAPKHEEKEAICAMLLSELVDCEA